MEDQKIGVVLDKGLVETLLKGLQRGAEKKSLKVIIDVEQNFHIKSQELRIIIETDDTSEYLEGIKLYNEKQYASVTREQLEKMGLTPLCNQVIAELKEKYSATAHSLADNILVFGRSYGGN